MEPHCSREHQDENQDSAAANPPWAREKRVKNGLDMSQAKKKKKQMWTTRNESGDLRVHFSRDLSDEPFVVHAEVLSEASDLMKAQVESSAIPGILQLEDTERAAFMHIVRYLYTGTLKIAMGNLQMIHQIAAEYELMDVIAITIRAFKGYLNGTVCLSILTRRAGYDDTFHQSKYFLKPTLEYAAVHLMKIVYNQLFVDLNFSHLVEILTLAKEKISPLSLDPVRLVNRINKWFDFQTDERSAYFKDIYQLTEALQSSPIVQSSMLKSIKREHPYGRGAAFGGPQNKRQRTKRPMKHVAHRLLIVTTQQLYSNRENLQEIQKLACIYEFDPKRKTTDWRSTQKINVVGSLGCAEHQGILYVCGGDRNNTGTQVETGQRNILDSNLWSPIAPMNIRRARHCLAALGDYLYAAGGSVNKLYATKTLERYDQQDNSWKKMSDMRCERAQFALIPHGGHLYAICGLDANQRPVNTMERYDPVNDHWETLADMPDHCGRANFAATVFEGLIYVVGGDKLVNPGSGSATTNIGVSAYKYDSVKNQWKVLHLPNSGYKPTCKGLAVFNKKLYAASLDATTQWLLLEVLDEEANVWVEVGRIESGNHDGKSHKFQALISV